MLRCIFKCHCPTQWGETVSVVGDRPELGAWDTSLAVRLRYSKDGWWESDPVFLSLSDISDEAFSYKYVVYKENEAEVIWEDGLNRAISHDAIEHLISPPKKGKQSIVYFINDFNDTTSNQIFVPNDPANFTRLEIMSFNIRRDCERDQRKGRGWDHRKHQIFERIRLINPEVIALQEVCRNQLEDLLEALPHYDFVGTGNKDAENKEEYNPIFYKKGDYKVLESGTFWLSEKPQVPGSIGWKSDSPRICTWVKFQMRKTPYPESSIFSVFNTQLDDISAKSRVRGLELVMTKIRNIKTPAILCGDFHELESDHLIQRIHTIPVSFPAVMFNAKLIAKQRNGPDSTYIGFSGTKDQVVDYVFVTTEIQIDHFEVIEENVFNESCLPSNHRPLFVQVDFKNCYQWKVAGKCH